MEEVFNFRKVQFFSLMVINLLNIKIHCQVQACISILIWCIPYPSVYTKPCTCWVLMSITPAFELHSRESHCDDPVSVFHSPWNSRYPVQIFFFESLINFFLFLRQGLSIPWLTHRFTVHQAGLQLRAFCLSLGLKVWFTYFLFIKICLFLQMLLLLFPHFYFMLKSCFCISFTGFPSFPSVPLYDCQLISCILLLLFFLFNSQTRYAICLSFIKVLL